MQWAYPATPWIAAVAAWVEDEVYPTLNRNRSYLRTSPLAKPGTSMIDVLGDDPAGHAEGRWIFLRFLSERFPAEVGGLPIVVRDIVERGADAALALGGTTMLKEFTTFTTWNRNPAAFYDEGAAYPTAPLEGNVMLSGVTNTRTFTGGAGQWTSHSFRFRPSSTLSGRWQIRLDGRSEGILQSSGKAFVATFKAKGRPAATRVIAMKDAELLTSGITLSFNTSVEWVELRVVTGEVGVGSNPSETGEPVYKVTAKVSRR